MIRDYDYVPKCRNCQHFSLDRKHEEYGDCELDYEPDVTSSYGWCPSWEERS